MNHFQGRKEIRTILVLILMIMFSFPILAQTTFMNSPLSNNLNQESNQGETKTKKKRNDFKIYGAVNFNNLNIGSEYYEPTTAIGWMLGGAYKSGKFFYWELGARYNRAVYDLHNANRPDTLSYLDRIVSISNVDVPLTFGISTLWFVGRIVDVRVFVSAIPEFVVGVNDNDIGVTKDMLHTFNICGQLGVGLDVTFIFLEVGIDYGFIDLFKDYSPSNPVQGFVALGFRF